MVSTTLIDSRFIPSLSSITTAKMAIAKPIRALLFGAMILCTFLFYTIYQTHTGPPLGPGDTIKTYDGTGNDPMGERKCTKVSLLELR